MTVADLTRRWLSGKRLGGLALAAMALGCAGPSGLAAAPREVDASVVWVGDAHVFVATRDTSGLERGARLTFVERRSVMATGTIERLLDAEVAVVRLDAGTLDRVKRPDRLKILVEPPAPSGPSTLRLGFPSARRTNLIFDCGTLTIESPDSSAGYRIEPAAGDLRLVRHASSTRGPWPDTLLVRLFDDAADEEIALESGQVDVAVFWPGEPSAHLRDGPFWREDSYGMRRRGLIVSVTAESDSATVPNPPGEPASPDFEALNRQVFRGDLGMPPTPGWAASVTPADSVPHRPRVVVDAAMPGQPILERFFKGRPAATENVPAGPITRLSYLDAAVDAPDSVAVALAKHVDRSPIAPWLRARASALLQTMELQAAAGRPAAPETRIQEAGDRLARCLSTLDAALLFSIRCPIAFGPELRPVVNAIGPRRLADMMACGPPGGR